MRTIPRPRPRQLLQPVPRPVSQVMAAAVRTVGEMTKPEVIDPPQPPAAAHLAAQIIELPASKNLVVGNERFPAIKINEAGEPEAVTFPIQSILDRVSRRQPRGSSPQTGASVGALAEHIADHDNPHVVTKAQVGLPSVDDVSAVELRDRATHTGAQAIATVTGLQAALDAKLAASAVNDDPTLASDSHTDPPSVHAVVGLFGTISSGQTMHTKVRVVMTTNVAIATALENGDTLNGVVLATGDGVLLVGQTDPKENGVYTVPVSGAASRRTTEDAGTELSGALIPVIGGGTLNDLTMWACVTTGTITIGVTNINFTQIPVAGAYLNGVGLLLAGSTFSIDEASQVAAEAGSAADKVMTPRRSTQHLAAKLPGTVMTPTDAAISRTMADLWGMDRLTINTQGTGADTDVTTAWNAAMAKAATRAKTAVMFGHGVFINPNNAALLVPASANKLVLFGYGAQATQLKLRRLSGNLIEVGAQGGGVANDIRFANLEILSETALASPNDAHLSGAMIAYENSTYQYLDDVNLIGGFRLVTYGIAATASNDCANCFISSLHGQNSKYSSTAAMILLASGSIFRLGGENRINGAGNAPDCAFISDFSAFNWDGVNVSGVIGEDVGTWVRCTGKGFASFDWDAGEIDNAHRAVNLFEISPSGTGLCKDWTIRGLKMGGPSLRGININPSGSANVVGVTISGNNFTNIDDNAIFVKTTDCDMIQIHGNTFRNCGRKVGGTAVISAGMRSGSIIGNSAMKDAGQVSYTVLVQWTGVAAPTIRSGPTAMTDGGTRAHNSAQNGSGSNSGLFSGSI